MNEDLQQLLDHIWTYAQSGVDERDNAMTTPVFATAGPAARTVALRRVHRARRILAFHTDVRSAKVGQLQRTARAVWVGWDDELGEQFQLEGPTTVHTDDEIADAMWVREPDENLKFYFKTKAPGERIDAPGSTIDEAGVDEQRARANFAVVRTVVDQITWLDLQPDREHRARFRFEENGFSGEWIVP